MGLITEWTVDYGSGPTPASVPHAWNQDVDVRWEGPAIYRANIEVPTSPAWLVFHGVSYAATVFVDGVQISRHEGIWDAFSVSLLGFENKSIELTVEVVKNGGSCFPVKSVASGFLPYVFNTFGGLYREVELVESPVDPIPCSPEVLERRIRVDGSKLYVDDQPFYVRGLLHWGWFPEIGHPNPPDEIIRKELRAVKEAGFNLVKFCLWVPSHRYLEIVREEGLEAWLELPLWDPSKEPEAQERIFQELERIVAQYRRHDNILIWTCGCELSESTPPEYRQRLVQMVKSLTRSPMVKDNSGGAEMYGGDLREFGDYDDFHPYCDLQFYPGVLDSLLPGPRPSRPMLLGEFNDYDDFRDLARLKNDQPYWMSDDPALNDQGVRWLHDLPETIGRMSIDPVRQRNLIECTRSKSEFVRRTVFEAVRARPGIGGFVITGWRDTPISSSGFFDAWGEPKGLNWIPSEGGDVAFLIPSRRPPWVHGGNRPGWRDPYNHFAGPVVIRIGLASERGRSQRIDWTVTSKGALVARGDLAVDIGDLEARQIGEIAFEAAEPGEYELSIESTQQKWNLSVCRPCGFEFEGWSLSDPTGFFEGLDFKGGKNLIATTISPEARQAAEDGGRVLLFLSPPIAKPMPFWRECGFEYSDESNDPTTTRFLKDFANRWERLLPISPDCALDVHSLKQAFECEFETVLSRFDTRTFVSHPILLRGIVGKGELFVTTLRPFGGLGVEPCGVKHNPAGAHLLSVLMSQG